MGVFAGSNDRCLGWWNWGGGGVVTVGSGRCVCVQIEENKGAVPVRLSTSDFDYCIIGSCLSRLFSLVKVI